MEEQPRNAAERLRVLCVLPLPVPNSRPRETTFEITNDAVARSSAGRADHESGARHEHDEDVRLARTVFRDEAEAFERRLLGWV
jgi:hypothetical protein